MRFRILVCSRLMRHSETLYVRQEMYTNSTEGTTKLSISRIEENGRGDGL